MPRKVIKVDVVKGVDLYVPATESLLVEYERQQEQRRAAEAMQPDSNKPKLRSLDLEGGK